MDASKKYRGKLSSVILSYTRDMEEDLKNAVPDRVFITHSGCDGRLWKRFVPIWKVWESLTRFWKPEQAV